MTTKQLREICDPIFDQHPHWLTNHEAERALRRELTEAVLKQAGPFLRSVSNCVNQEMLRRALLAIRQGR